MENHTLKIRKSKHCYILLVGILVMLANCGGEPAPNSYSKFKGTPAWELAKAVRANDTAKITRLIQEDGINVDYQEPWHGYTVLMVALANRRSFPQRTKLETVEGLLKNGARPNLYSNDKMGMNAVLVACQENYPQALELLLKQGGDPNSQVRSKLWKCDDTALSLAAASLARDVDNLETVKILVEAGADINFQTLRGSNTLWICGNFTCYKILLYLLEKGADCNLPFGSLLNFDENGNQEKITILQSLRESTPKLGTEEHYYKHKIIEFLKRKGLDYDTVPIPPQIVSWAQKEYPDSWQDYLKKY